MTMATIFELLAAAHSGGQVTVVRDASDDGIRLARRHELDRIVEANAVMEAAEDLALEGDISKEKLRSLR